MSWTGNNHGARGSRPNRGRGGHQVRSSSNNSSLAATNNLKHSNLPPPPTSSLENRASFFPRRLFTATSAAEDRNHLDDLLNEIPFHEKAVAEFNSNTPGVPPFRDIPSSLIAALSNPVPGPEPDWRAMITGHFPTANAIRPMSNLQDLYLWVTRVGIPNAVIDNRRFLLNYYVRNPNASMNLRLRYDALPSINTYVPIAREPRASPSDTIQNHSIFRDYPTPSGARFAQWLATPIHVPVPRNLPSQMYHQRSFLDGFLAEDEAAVRQVAGGALVDRTVGVLKLFWEMWMRNRGLQEFQDRGWVGTEEDGRSEDGTVVGR
jgi:hypothetical protein